MDEQSKGFRGAVFGGFKREDVLRYIEETDTRYFSETEELRRQLAEAQAAMGELRGQNEKLTEKNAELIAEIEGGIKKEVSVGCAVEKVVCSICGQELGQCGHEKGKQYHGKLCFGELTGATDAYEWSFVAVPAQKNAGVMKRMGWERQKQLEQEAELGRRYVAGLRREVARLGGLTEGGLEAPALERIAARLEEPELLELKQVFEARLRRRWPIESQLNDTGETKRETARDGAFLI